MSLERSLVEYLAGDTTQPFNIKSVPIDVPPPAAKRDITGLNNHTIDITTCNIQESNTIHITTNHSSRLILHICSFHCWRCIESCTGCVHTRYFRGANQSRA